MQISFRPGFVRRAIRDGLLGAGLFMVGAVGFAGDPKTWDFTRATAADRMLSQTLDVTAPPGLQSELALAASLIQPAPAFDAASKGATMLVLGLTFSFMFAFNLAIVRHLRRVYASRGEVSGGGAADHS